MVLGADGHRDCERMKWFDILVPLAVLSLAACSPVIR
jgi:hypothetical protein